MSNIAWFLFVLLKPESAFFFISDLFAQMAMNKLREEQKDHKNKTKEQNGIYSFQKQLLKSITESWHLLELDHQFNHPDWPI